MAEKILVVDDEPDMLRLLSMIIRDKTNFDIVTTNNPLEAFEIVKQGDLNLIIADLKMPGLDGSQLLEKVKAYNPDLPVIIMTAFATEEAEAETMAKGGFDFIIKPFRKEQILATIEKGIRWGNMQRENRMLKLKLGNN